jgi:integrase
MSDALATISVALVDQDNGTPPAELLRAALYGWAFNPSKWAASAPSEMVETLRWVEERSLPIVALASPDIVRRALNACARTLSGKPAAATTTRRKRAVFANALGFAVERELLGANPMDKVQWKAAEVARSVDRRVVANPTQVRILLDAVRRQGRRGPHLVAFFACLYFAAMRPSEVLALRASSCNLPRSGWGRLDLSGSEPSAGREWTDTGTLREARELKHRGEADTRSVPIPPELVGILREHIAAFGLAEDGRLFRSEAGGLLQDTAYGAVWRRARDSALTPEQRSSPLARRPYDLRHAGISLWLNAGVAATEVARRAGHGVAVMLHVYANCIDGEDRTYNERIERALMPVGERAEGSHRGRLAGASGKPLAQTVGGSWAAGREGS